MSNDNKNDKYDGKRSERMLECRNRGFWSLQTVLGVKSEHINGVRCQTHGNEHERIAWRQNVALTRFGVGIALRM